jgi:hypothetical protein
VRKAGAQLLIGDERRTERGNRLADHLTFLEPGDSEFRSQLFLVASEVTAPPNFPPLDPALILSSPDLGTLAEQSLANWRDLLSKIPTRLVVEATVERWSDSWARATVPGGAGVPAKAKWLFTTRAGVPSNVVDVEALDIPLVLPGLPAPPLPPLIVLFDQRDLATTAGAAGAKIPDLTPMVTAIAAVSPTVAAVVDPLIAVGATLTSVIGLLAALPLGPLSAFAPGSSNLQVGVTTVGKPFELDSLTFRPGGFLGIGRVSAEDIARSALITGPPGTVVNLHNGRGGTAEAIVVTVPPRGYVTIPAIFRQNGTALPVSDPPGAATLLNGVEPGWPWSTFRDNVSSVTFVSATVI